MPCVSTDSNLALYAQPTDHHTQALRLISIALAANSQNTIAAIQLDPKKVLLLRLPMTAKVG
jgi:hypothetical protein